MTGRLFSDVTQSWSEKGGGVRTYLNRKRRFLMEETADHHLLIIPGNRDSVSEEYGGRARTVTIASPRVPGSPNYRLLLRNRAVRAALADNQPDLIECQDSYNLPWAAIGHRKRWQGTALVASFMTDFPTAYARRIGQMIGGAPLGHLSSRIAYRYIASLYRRFDGVVALSAHGGADKLLSLGIDRVSVVPLGVDIEDFSPDLNSPSLRVAAGCAEDAPLLIYVGRLDHEKRAQTVVDAFARLPAVLGARLVLIGAGPLRAQFAALPGVYAPGFIRDRHLVARWLASADLYVSGMADETFGISVIEAQASGLPVVGVAAGAMIDRVPTGLGLLGPVDDPSAMAANIMTLLADPDRGSTRIAARAHAAGLSWDAAMRTLFDTVYPAALARRTTLLSAGSRAKTSRDTLLGPDIGRQVT